MANNLPFFSGSTVDPAPLQKSLRPRKAFTILKEQEKHLQ